MSTIAKSDYSELLSAFNAAGVEYLIVGAHALALHGYQRYTKDFDLWVRPSPENASRVFDALRSFGAPLDKVSVHDFADEDVVFQIGVEPVRIDIIMAIEGVRWDDAWRDRVEGIFEDVPAPYLGLESLIQNKNATGRPRDAMDVSELLRIRNAPPLED